MVARQPPLAFVSYRLIDHHKELRGCVRRSSFSLLTLFSSAVLHCVSLLLPVSRAQKSRSHSNNPCSHFLASIATSCHNAKQKVRRPEFGGFSGCRAPSRRTAKSGRTLSSELRTGQMPPKGMPRPDKASLEQCIALDRTGVRARRPACQTRSGRVTARRLNRAEYNNTVRDLLGVDIEPANDFPQDDSAHGFDNIADALSLSPTLMEKYMAAAEKIARLAVFGPELKPLTFRIEPTRPRRLEINPVRIEQPPFYTMHDYDATGISHPGSYHLTHRFPATGEYLFRVRADGAKPPGSEPQDVGSLSRWQDRPILRSAKQSHGNQRTVAGLYGSAVESRRGQHQLIAAFPRLFEGLPPSFNGPNPSKLPQPPPPDPARFFPPLPANATPEQIKAREAAIERFKSRKPTFDGMAIAEFEIIGPFEYVKGLRRRNLQKLYTCGHFEWQHQSGLRNQISRSIWRIAPSVVRSNQPKWMALTAIVSEGASNAGVRLSRRLRWPCKRFWSRRIFSSALKRIVSSECECVLPDKSA